MHCLWALQPADFYEQIAQPRGVDVSAVPDDIDTGQILRASRAASHPGAA